MQQTTPQPHHSIDTLRQEASLGRITVGSVYLELPVDAEHKANRTVLGVLSRELKDVQTGNPVLTFQQLADQLGYGDRRDVQNFHRELRMSDFDVPSFVTRKAAKHDRLFPLLETIVLETPLLSAHQQYLSFCETHPEETLSEETFRTYANEIDGVKIRKRVQQLGQGGE